MANGRKKKDTQHRQQAQDTPRGQSAGRVKKRGRRRRAGSAKRRFLTAGGVKRRLLAAGVIAVVVAAVAAVGIFSVLQGKSGSDADAAYAWPSGGVQVGDLQIDVQLLTVNPYSRSGKELEQINGIVVHYTANPGTTGQENRDYFESLKDSHATKASSNFIVGLDGEVIQCVPTWEEAYASNDRNDDTISIECCHPDDTGKFTDETYWSLVRLCAFLCEKYGLDEDDIIRHYDVTGKVCPKYFVDNEDAFLTFRSHVGRVLSGEE